MANQGCPGEGPDKRFAGWLICPLQRLLSYKSKKPYRWLFRRTKPTLPAFFDYVETLRRLGKIPPSMDYEKKDEVWYLSFVSFGLGWPPYLIFQGGKPNKRFRLYLGWRRDTNWGGFIAPALLFKRKQKNVLHRGY